MNQTAIAMVRKITLWPLSRLRAFERNPRDHSAEQVDQIARSIEEFGFNNPILVDAASQEIVAGHGRLLAAQKLEMPEVPVVELSHLSPAMRQAYVIADNKLALNARWNYDLLAELLAELPSLDLDPTLSGFDTVEIDAIVNGWKPDFEQPHPTTHDSPLLARIVVTCDPARKAEVMDALEAAINTCGIPGVEMQR